MKKQSLSGDALWQRIREEAKAEVAAEPALASFLNLTVLRHDSLSRVLAFHLSGKLSNAVSAVLDARALYEIFMQVLRANPDIIAAAEADILAHFERDPACNALSTPLLYFKGFHALQRTALTINCGKTVVRRSLIACKIVCRKCLAWIFTLQHELAKALCWIMAQAL